MLGRVTIAGSNVVVGSGGTLKINVNCLPHGTAGSVEHRNCLSSCNCHSEVPVARLQGCCCCPITPRSRSGWGSLRLQKSAHGQKGAEIIQEENETTDLLRQTFHVLKLLQDITGQLGSISELFTSKYMGLHSQLKKTMDITIPLIFRMFGAGGNGEGCISTARSQVLKEINRMREFLVRIQKELDEERVRITEGVVPALVLRGLLYVVWEYFWTFVCDGEAFFTAREEFAKCNATIDTYLLKLMAISTGCRDPQRKIYVGQVQICDFFGRDWSLPHDLCVRREVFMQILRFKFEDGPAKQIVAFGLFNIFHIHEGSSSEPRTDTHWTTGIEAGGSLQLSVLVNRQSWMQRTSIVEGFRCPRCDGCTVVVDACYGWADCLKCDSMFNVSPSRQSSMSATVELDDLDYGSFKFFSVLQAQRRNTSDSEHNSQLETPDSDVYYDVDSYQSSLNSRSSPTNVTLAKDMIYRKDTCAAVTVDSTVRMQERINESSTKSQDGQPSSITSSAHSLTRDPNEVKDSNQTDTTPDNNMSSAMSPERGPRVERMAPSLMPYRLVVGALASDSMRESFKSVMSWQDLEIRSRAVIGGTDLGKLAGRIREQPVYLMVIIHQSLGVAENARLACRRGFKASRILLEGLDNPDRHTTWYTPDTLNSSIQDSIETLVKMAKEVHHKFRLLRTLMLDIGKDITRLPGQGEQPYLIARMNRYFGKDISYEEAFQKIHGDIKEVGKSLDLTTGWWQKVETAANHLRTNNTSRIHMPDANKILLYKMKDTWVALETYLADYIRKMRQLHEENDMRLSATNSKNRNKVKDCIDLTVAGKGRFEPKKI